MDNRVKRFLSLAMAIIMVIGLMPSNIVFATENEGGQDPAIVADEPDQTPEPPAQETPQDQDNAGQEPAPVAMLLAEECTITEGCVSGAGHTGDCMDANGQILVNMSNVFTEKGLRAAVGVGGTIKLTGNIVLHGALTIGSTVTLDLNGNSITAVAAEEGKSAPKYALINNGTLTVNDTGANGSIGGIDNNGTLTVNAGTIFAASADTDAYAVNNNGTATINGGTFNHAGSGYALWNRTSKTMLVKSGTITGVYNNQGNLDIDGGKFYSAAGMNAVWSVGGDLDISAGQFQKDEDNTAVATVKVDGAHNSAAISGGSFSHTKGLSLELADTATVTIGGTAEVDDGIKVASEATLTINGGTFRDQSENSYAPADGAAITVNGGTFVGEHAQNFAEPYAAPKKVILFDTNEMVKTADDAVTVSPVIAKIGSDAYPSLEAAAAGAKTGDEIKLVAGEELQNYVLIKKDLAITLDLNGQALEATIGNNSRVIEIQAGASLTIKDSSATANSQGTGSVTNYATWGNALVNFGSLTVYGGTFNGDYALYNGSYTNSTATAILYGGTFNATGTEAVSIANCSNMTVAGAIVNDCLDTSGTFVMTDGTVYDLVAGGADAAVASGISTEISGGEITCLDVCNSKGTLNNNAVTIKGAADIETVKVGKYESVAAYSAVNIEAGTIGSVGAYTFDDSNVETPVTNAPISITGGTFTAEPYSGYVETGYETIVLRAENGNIYGYKVQLKKADLETPVEDNFTLKDVGTGMTLYKSSILNEIAANDSIKEAENDSGYLLVIKPESIVVDKGEADGTYKTSKITYDVSLRKPNTDTNEYNIHFNLPIPGTIPSYVEYANVYHNGEFLQKCEIKEITIDGTDYFYVTVTSATFSPFTVELIDYSATKHSARIGVKGYETVQAAVNAAENGDVIELLDITSAAGVKYGKVLISDTNGNNAKQIIIDGMSNTWLIDDNEAIVEIVRGAGDAGLVTIRNVNFNKTSGSEIIKITGNGEKETKVQINNCTFTDPGKEKNIVAIRLKNTNGVQIQGTSDTSKAVASFLSAFLVNEGGKNLTVQNIKVEDSTVGMTLGQTTGVKVTNVDITAANNQYGISLEGSADRFTAEFNNCTIDAYVPVMVWNTDANGNIAFKGSNTFTARNEGKYWCVLGDQAFVGESAPKNAADLSTGKDDRIIITVTDTKLNGNGINYKHKDETNASERKYYTVAPEGRLDVAAVVFDDAATKNDSRISVDIDGLVASERVVLKVVDAQGNTVAESKLADPDNVGYVYFNALTGVAGISRPDGTWETTWVEDGITGEEVPTYKTVPAKVYLVVDGKVLNADNPTPVLMNAEGTPARLWTDVEGVGNMTLSINGGAARWKHSLAEAFDAVPASATAVNKGTVTLFADNDAILSAFGEVTGNKEITVTGTATFNWDLGEEWLYVGRGENPGNGTLIFDDAHIRAHGDGDDTGLNISGKKESDAKVCNGTVKVINGSDVEVDFINNRNLLEVSGGAKGPSTLTVKHGFHVNGRKGAPDAKVEVKGGSHLIISQDLLTTATLGDDVAQEGNGILNVIGSRFTCVGKFNVASGSAFNVSGTSTLNIGEAVGKPINLLDDAVIVNSSVGGAAVANGAENAKINVKFENTVKFDRVETKYTDVTATGVNNFGNLSVLFGELHTNTESKINVGRLIVDEAGEPIIIDTTNLQTAAAVRVINQVKDTANDITSRVTTTETASYAVYGEGEDAGDVVVSKVDRTKVYFNPAYKRTDKLQFGDKTPDGRFQGVNAFEKFKNGADKALVLPEETTTIVLAAGNKVEESYGVLWNTKDLIVETEGEGYAAISRFVNMAKLTFDANSKVKVLAGDSSLVFNEATVNGELELMKKNDTVATLTINDGSNKNGKLIIGAAGKLTTDGFINNGGAIEMAYTSRITAKDITGLDSETNTITIDTTGMVATGKVLVIDLSGDAATATRMKSDNVSVLNNAAAKWIDADNGGDVNVYYEAFIDLDKNNVLNVGEGFATVEIAILKAPDEGVVTLLADAEAAELTIDKSLTLNLNGHSIKKTNPLYVESRDNEITVTIKNGTIETTEADSASIKAFKGSHIELVKATVIGKGQGIALYQNAAVSVDKDSQVTGAPAVMIYGGTLKVNGGKVTAANGADAIVSTFNIEEDMRGNASVNISGGEVTGPIVIEDASYSYTEPKKDEYEAALTITGGKFLKSKLDMDYVDKEYGVVSVSNVDNEAIFDEFVPLQMCATDYICQEKKDSNPVMYEVVPYEHVRIFMNEVDDYEDENNDGTPDEKILVGGDTYVNGKAYKVQPGKVLLIDKEMAKTHRMFITTYTYETKGTADTKDDYPNAMYVWYAEGKDKRGDIYTSYTVERFERLDNFFEYNGTSIRIGGTGNGIRFISSVDETDVRLLMNGTMIEEGALGGAKLTEMGTEFWKTNRARSQVFGGTLGNQFNIYKTVNGRNRFTGMLVNLGASEAVVAEPFFSRPYAVIQLKGTEETMTLFGGTLERSIYYVAQQVDAAGSFHGTPYDSYVKNLLNLGANYRPESGTGNS